LSPFAFRASVGEAGHPETPPLKSRLPGENGGRGVGPSDDLSNYRIVELVDGDEQTACTMFKCVSRVPAQAQSETPTESATPCGSSGIPLRSRFSHAVVAFREQDWAAEVLTPAAVLRVEVHPPPVVHDVPLNAVERWLRSPSTSPKEMTTKIAAGSRRVRREP
jgi:hypothetical protein